MDIQEIISFLLALTILLFAVRVFEKIRKHDLYKNRLKTLVYHRQMLEEQEAPHAIKPKRHLPPFLESLIEHLHSLTENQKATIKLKFERAGYPPQNAIIVYTAAKFISMLLGVAIASLVVVAFPEWSVAIKVVIFGVLVFVGAYAVDGVIDHKCDSRLTRIHRAFPDAIDLMVVCAEAGLSLDNVIRRVSDEILPISPDLSYELALLAIELDFLPDSKKAFKNFAVRLGSDKYTAVIVNLAQSEQYGTPIAKALRSLADELRQDQLLEAEVRVARLPVLITLPLVLCFLPVILIVVLGPPIINYLYQS